MSTLEWFLQHGNKSLELGRWHLGEFDLRYSLCVRAWQKYRSQPLGLRGRDVRRWVWVARLLAPLYCYNCGIADERNTGNAKTMRRHLRNAGTSGTYHSL